MQEATGGWLSLGYGARRTPPRTSVPLPAGAVARASWSAVGWATALLSTRAIAFLRRWLERFFSGEIARATNASRWVCAIMDRLYWVVPARYGGYLEEGHESSQPWTQQNEYWSGRQRYVEQELKQSYVDYAMSVIVGRVPDVRDGLKPVHRRVA